MAGLQRLGARKMEFDAAFFEYEEVSFINVGSSLRAKVHTRSSSLIHHPNQCKNSFKDWQLDIRMCIMCLTPSTWKVQNGKARSAVETTACCPPPILFTGQRAK